VNRRKSNGDFLERSKRRYRKLATQKDRELASFGSFDSFSLILTTPLP
jgi:hypothetical protein